MRAHSSPPRARTRELRLQFSCFPRNCPWKFQKKSWEMVFSYFKTRAAKRQGLNLRPVAGKFYRSGLRRMKWPARVSFPAKRNIVGEGRSPCLSSVLLKGRATDLPRLSGSIEVGARSPPSYAKGLRAGKPPRRYSLIRMRTWLLSRANIPF